MAKFINLTAHEINIRTAKGKFVNIPASGIIARVASETKVVDTLDGIPITSMVFGDVYGLPNPEPDTYYIASLMVAKAAGRSDVLVPAETLRDGSGRICGCKSLGIYRPSPSAEERKQMPWKQKKS